MLSMTREGPYLILGNKGKLVAGTLHRLCVLKLPHPLLYDDDTLTHEANGIKRTFLIVGSKIVYNLEGHGHTWIFNFAPFLQSNATIITPVDWWCFLHCGGAAVAEWLSSWLAEQEDRGSIPGLATWIFRDWLSPASKSRYGWKIAKSTLILKTTNQQPSLRQWLLSDSHWFLGQNMTDKCQI